jgi:hypothetical protein
MSRTHVIEHQDGGAWLSQHGFVKDIAGAMRFATEDDGRSYLASTFPQARHNVIKTELFDHGGVTPVEQDYDPFGLQASRR